MISLPFSVHKMMADVKPLLGLEFRWHRFRRAEGARSIGYSNCSVSLSGIFGDKFFDISVIEIPRNEEFPLAI